MRREASAPSHWLRVTPRPMLKRSIFQAQMPMYVEEYIRIFQAQIFRLQNNFKTEICAKFWGPSGEAGARAGQDKRAKRGGTGQRR